MERRTESEGLKAGGNSMPLCNIAVPLVIFYRDRAESIFNFSINIYDFSHYESVSVPWH